jgi:hypothetical protein
MNWFQKVLDRFKSCPEEVGDAVLTVLLPILNDMPSVMTVWCRGYDQSLLKELDDYQKEIFRIRTWARETPMAYCVRKEYNHWLDFYQKWLDEVFLEMATHAREKMHEEFSRRQREETEQRQAYLLANPIPVPPRRS